jgi:acyl transferase domain-containing protein
MICLHEVKSSNTNHQSCFAHSKFQASQALRNNECTAAIVAGTNLILTPTQTIAQSEAGVLSPTGECRTFDASANGYARGEAINALLIKKLSDAIRDGDMIRAVVRSTAVNCDGRSAGLSTPNPEAHVRMIRRAYEVGGLSDPSETPYVEVHGTGTPSGDPLELEAIARVFGDNRDTYIASVKANVGHGEGASGITSLIKAVLALEHRIIPPQVNFSTPNPRIPFQKSRLVVPLSPVPWPENRPERVSVNSFGITGANAHAVIESAAFHGIHNSKCSTAAETSKDSDSHLLVLSATTAESLKTKWANIQSYITTYPNSIRDLAHTLANNRDHLSHKAYCITDAQGLGELASMEKVKQVPILNLVFTGQGASWQAMGKELIETIPSFREDISYMADVLTRIPHPPSWNLVNELLKEGPKSHLDQAEFAQPLCTAIQVALVNLLRVLCVKPSAVVGHSSGEIAAAFAAGAVTLEEAITIAYYRGFVASKSTRRRGAMAAIGVGKAEATLYLEDGVLVACENSPHSVTLSGDEEALDRIIEQMKYDDPDIFARKLKTDGMAYHSHHMLEIGETYEKYLKPLLAVQQPNVKFFSSVTGKLASDKNLLDAKYWRQNLESPVRFFSAVRSLLENQDSDQLFLEIGPHSALAGPLRQIFKASTSKVRLSYCSSLIRGKDSMGSILDTCGQLYLHGIPLKFQSLTPGGRTLTDLPNYPWLHNVSHWSENRVIKEW